MKHEEIKKLDEENLMQTYKRYDISIAKGRGSYVWDTEGKKYLDAFAGIAVCSLGHANPKIVQTLEEQGKKLMHVSNYFYIEEQAQLGRLLNSISPFPASKAFFCSTGTEANEAAIKLARKKTGKKGIIAMKGSFHGRTMGALSITWKKKAREPFEPLVPGVRFVEYGNIRELEKAIDEDTAAVFIEPVQGESGVRLPGAFAEAKKYFKEVRSVCDEKSVVMVSDEVQTGMGRTGKMFCCENYGVVPDIITLAKGLGGGFPIGCVLAKDEVAGGFSYGDHGTTFGGNPLACAVSTTVVKEILNEKLMDRSADIGKRFMEKLDKLCSYPSVKEVRGLGLLVAVEVKDKETAGKIRLKMKEKGVLVNVASDVNIRIAPALNIKEEELDIIYNSLKECVEEL